MSQRPIPFHFIRGGTSRGPYFNRADLPEDLDALSAVLIEVIGAGNPRNIDGIGGGDAVTTKVAMLSRSSEQDVDIDYFFGQVAVTEEMVDYGPTCGNILVGVGPAAIEMGLVPISGDATTVRIRAVNTGALVEAVVQTPGGKVCYSGDAAIDGVPGTAAPVALKFLDVVGSKCGAMFPTGQRSESIDGIEVSCVDVAMPMMIARAESFGLSGYETFDALNANTALFAAMEPIRLEAGKRMGLGDVSKSVTPKIGLIAPPKGSGHLAARYFMPWKAHPSLAVTGSQCLAACALASGTVAEGIARPVLRSPEVMRIEHPMGEIEVTVEFARDGETLDFRSAGLVRTGAFDRARRGDGGGPQVRRMSSEKVYDALAHTFLREGVDTCFALLGDANMNFATRLAEGGCKMIYVRHEHCAVAAAMAFARKSGKTGVATVTCGPGLTQLMTALPAAVRANLPLVVLAGEAPLKSGWYNQAIDQAPFVTATGAAYHALHHAARMPVAVRDAFLQARRECRPVVLGVPFDLQNSDWSGADLPIRSQDIDPVVSPMPPNPVDVVRAARMIDASQRIVVMAGLGAVKADAGDACRELAERCDALLATTLPARGLFCDAPFSVGIAGGFSTETARECLGQADLIIGVGTSLAHHNADGGSLWPNARMLQIDVDPIAVSQGRLAATAHVRADARLGVEALISHLPKREQIWRTRELADRIATAPADSAVFPQENGLHDPRDVVSALEAALPADWQMVNSSGHCSFYFAQMPSRPQTHFLTIREFGAIGNGIAFAMGVAAARPDDTVVLFDGDGSLLMHIQELETIHRHGMNILFVVMNDGAYGSEIHKLRADGLSDQGAVFGRPDLAAIARGFGLAGQRITDLDVIPGLIDAFASTGGATVWDVPISDKIASPVIRRAHPAK